MSLYSLETTGGNSMFENLADAANWLNLLQPSHARVRIIDDEYRLVPGAALMTERCNSITLQTWKEALTDAVTEIVESASPWRNVDSPND